MKNVKIIRLQTGEDIIGDVSESQTGDYIKTIHYHTASTTRKTSTIGFNSLDALYR